MTTKALIKKFEELQGELISYNHALGVLSYDAATVAPTKSYVGRGLTMATLSKVNYELIAGKKTQALLAELNARRAELDARTARILDVAITESEKITKIPRDEYVEFQVLCNTAEAVWHKAKPANDFNSFKPYLEKIAEGRRRFASYAKPDMDPYDYLLGSYEKGLTRAELDVFFRELRNEITPLLRRIQAAPQVDDSFLKGSFPIPKQREFSDYLMSVLGVDTERCIIGETEHPFTTGFNYDDMRVTTHYHEDNLLSSMYSVVHECGHAIYELGADKSLWRTIACTGTSMGIHESQSRFYENIIGRSREFIALILPKMKELFPQLQGVSAEQMYRAANKVTPSLIRTEADELTYALHIMVRYELEDDLIHGRLAVCDLPQRWRELYKEYLCVDVPDDTRGVLQDSHWSSALFGYFPSYALGSAYGVQMLASLQKDIDWRKAVTGGDLSPIVGWLTDKIYKHQKLLDPAEVILSSCGASFDPKYFVNYLKLKFSDIYGL